MTCIVGGVGQRTGENHARMSMSFVRCLFKLQIMSLRGIRQLTETEVIFLHPSNLQIHPPQKTVN